jgi:hypothetical protein
MNERKAKGADVGMGACVRKPVARGHGASSSASHGANASHSTNTSRINGSANTAKPLPRPTYLRPLKTDKPHTPIAHEDKISGIDVAVNNRRPARMQIPNNIAYSSGKHEYFLRTEGAQANYLVKRLPGKVLTQNIAVPSLDKTAIDLGDAGVVKRTQKGILGIRRSSAKSSSAGRSSAKPSGAAKPPSAGRRGNPQNRPAARAFIRNKIELPPFAVLQTTLKTQGTQNLRRPPRRRNLGGKCLPIGAEKPRNVVHEFPFRVHHTV